ncbi:MAG: ABC transporter ATP-binding protein [Myxococcota bacterium]
MKTFSQGPAAVRALDGVDLRVNSGEFVAIMGASGSGKSTLLHVVAGLTSIDKGVVKVAGEDIGSLGDKQLSSFRRRTIGLVFQAFNLIPTLSAEDNVALPGLGDHEVRSRAAQLLDRLGLADRRHHHPDALSGGEQQRVAIARALVMNPPLMLADEPTGSLDSVAGQDLCRLLYELRSEQQRTVVVVTHEPTVAMWADRVIVLADGRCRTQFVPKGDHDPVALSDAYQQALRSDLA